MSEVPQELKYTESHEWLRKETDGVYSVGITDHAQQLLGDLVFVDLPEVGQEFDRADDIAVVESVKAASDVYAPVAGEVIAINESLQETPAVINNDAYGEGWLFQLRVAHEDEVEKLMDATAYKNMIEE